MAFGRLGLILCCGLLVGLAPPARTAPGDSAPAQPAALTVAPPRTVTDITGVLGAYKPDPQRAGTAKAAADRQPPVGQSDAALASFYLERGTAAAQVGRMTQQLDDLRQALAYADKAGSDRSPILGRLMSAEAQAGNFALAIRYAEERTEIDDRRGARSRLFVTYHQLVKFNIKRGNLAEAERWLERSRALYAELGQAPPRAQRGEAQARGNQGQRGPGMGGGKRAGNDAPAPAASPAADMRTLHRPAWRTAVASAEADLLEARGLYRQAEAAFRTAIEQSDAYLHNLPSLPPNERPPVEFFQNSRNELIARLAGTLLQQGKLVDAEVEARHALVNTLKDVGRYHPWTAGRLAQVGWAVLAQGRATEAEQLARATLGIYEAIDATRSWGQAGARAELAGALVAQARWAEALASYDAMMAGLAGDQLGTRKFGFGGLDWATALIKMGRLEPALAMVNRVLERRRKFLGEQHYGTALARAYLGMALAAQGLREPALQAFAAALPILLGTPQAEDGPTARAHRLHLLLDAYIRLLAEVRGTPIETKAQLDAAAEAFRLADAARSQAVQKAVDAASARASLRDPALADLARREQDRGQELAGLEGTLVNALAESADQQDAGTIDVLRDQIAQLRQAREALRQDIARRFPSYAELINPKPPTLEQARQALRPGETLFATYASNDVTFVWAVPHHGQTAFAKVSLGAAQLDTMVKQLRRALDPQAQRTGDIPPFDVALAHKLYETLLKPVEAGWKGATSLLVVTDKALGQLPLGVLVTAPTASPTEAGQALFVGYKPVPFLARQVAITQLPSVAALATLRALPAASAERRPFIGFGDPVFSAKQVNEPRGTQVADAGTLTTRGVTLKLRSVPRTEQSDSADLAMLPRLPETAEEMRSIARALKADPDKDVFVGAAATERAVETANLVNRRVIAFATHGLVPGDLNGLTQPALALSAPLAGGQGDGLLTMGKILGLKLNADWVVLS
ncbi:MAG: CHAT domain-containing protein, partial [Proteobacteria bacterium]|nr:CHAT domain-containing protein [Pseudomonadota bacterium]